MSHISLLLFKVHDNVHDYQMKLNYSEPKIYAGGINISNWKLLSKKEKDTALSKSWYLYYSFRNPETGKLVRQPNIKAGVNSFKTYKERIRELKILRKALITLLESGYNPFKKENFEVKYKNNNLNNNPNNNKSNNVVANSNEVKVNSIKDSKPDIYSFIKAKKLVLETKKKVLSENSYPNFRSRINLFEKWLLDKNLKLEMDITEISKSLIIEYLNHVLSRSSARNRNNSRTDLSSFFQVLEDNDVIKDNFVKKINILKSKPIRNKTYTVQLQKDIFKYMEQNDSLLLLFVQFISYNFLRPIELCRLKIKDLDIKEKKIYVKAKNQPVKTKIIPEILVKQLPELSELDPNSYLFTPKGLGVEWSASERDKRNYFTKRFKKVKDNFGLGKEYGLYSFRHTFITKLYNEMIKEATPFEAKSRLKLITGHSTMTALEKYLRDIDAQLPEDYSKLIK